MTILVVEDEHRIAAFVRKGLSARGYDAETVSTGGAALTRLAEGGVALVILDLGLPDLDGVEVLKRLRHAGSHVPVIVLTAWHDADEQIRELGLAIDGYITKPFVVDQLAMAVQIGLARGTADEQGLASNARRSRGVP
jgi:DNA-binding response OmpR family regulator